MTVAAEPFPGACPRVDQSLPTPSPCPGCLPRGRKRLLPLNMLPAIALTVNCSSDSGKLPPEREQALPQSELEVDQLGGEELD